MTTEIYSNTVQRRYRRSYYSETQVRFPDVPPAPYREVLKRYGFRWHRAGKYWYAPSSIARATVLDCLHGGCTDLDDIALHVAECEAEAACGII
jgi:hypothetical protein